MQKILGATYRLSRPDDLAFTIPVLYGVYVNHYAFTYFFLQVECLVISSELEDLGLLFYSQGVIMIRNLYVFSIADDISTAYFGFVTKAFLE
jgi:hypothetical protein